MAGGTSAFDMIPSLRNNRNVKSGRTKMGDNPYVSKSVGIENRNSANTKELIAHRFERKDFSTQLTKRVYLALGLLILMFFAYFFLIQ